MFRISIYLKEDVVPKILQMVLNFVIKRFPKFDIKFKIDILGHYL